LITPIGFATSPQKALAYARLTPVRPEKLFLAEVSKMILLVLTATSFVAGIFSRLRKSEEPDLDQLVLDQLKRAGSNLAKPHDIEFYLYFPTEEAANAAAKEINIEVDRLKVRVGADDVNWLCLGTKSMLPKADELRRLRTRFIEITNRYQGEYDGWECGVVRD
jgi:hypothetical protein